jgi:hypothetical protein
MAEVAATAAALSQLQPAWQSGVAGDGGGAPDPGAAVCG